MNTTQKTIITLLGLSVGFAILGQFLHTYGQYEPIASLPEVGHWTNCARLTDICEFPGLEQYNLDDILVYRFPNGTMIGMYVGEGPASK